MQTELNNSNFGYSKLLVLIIELFLLFYGLGFLFTILAPFIGIFRDASLDNVNINIRLISLAVLFYVLLQIRTLLKSAICQKVFDDSIFKKFKMIGFIFIGLDALKAITVLVLVLLNHPFYQENFAILYQNISWKNFITGLAFLSISEIIRLGVKIKEENDLTV